MTSLKPIVAAAIFALALVTSSFDSFAQPGNTSFIYQGYLKSSGAPVNGLHDFRFRLYDAPTGRENVGTGVVANGIAVNDGLFSLSLNFGDVFDGTERWLEIDVKPAGTGSYTLLAPRQLLAPSPQAHYASKAGEATIATTALNGIPAGSSVLGDSQIPPPGFSWSGSQIQVNDKQWVTLASYPQYLSGSAGASVNGKFYVIGNNSTSVYDPLTNAWDNSLAVQNGPANPWAVTHVALLANTIYSMFIDNTLLGGSSFMTAYSPASDTWTSKASPPVVFRSGATVGHDWKIYYFGSTTASPNTTYIYDPATDTWSTGEPLPTAIEPQQAVSADGKIYVLGTVKAYVYDPAMDGQGGGSAWTQIATMPTNRYDFVAAFLNGKIHCLGGVQYLPNFETVHYDLNEIYDIGTNSWSTGIPMPSPRTDPVGAVIGNNLYLTLGYYNDSSSHLLTSTIKFSPETYSYIHVKN